jgi:hypothetical protein
MHPFRELLPSSMLIESQLLAPSAFHRVIIPKSKSLLWLSPDSIERRQLQPTGFFPALSSQINTPETQFRLH